MAAVFIPSRRGGVHEAVGLSRTGRPWHQGRQVPLTSGRGDGKRASQAQVFAGVQAGGGSITHWMTFTPDANSSAATLMGHAIQLIDVETAGDQDVRARRRGSSCVFLSTGKRWQAAIRQENVSITPGYGNSPTGKELRRLRSDTSSTDHWALAFFARRDKNSPAPPGATGRLRLFEVATGKELTSSPRSARIRGIAFAPDGKTARGRDRIYLYDPATGKERIGLIGRRGRSPSTGTLGFLTGAVSGAIYRWDAASGRQLTPAAAPGQCRGAVLVSADAGDCSRTGQDGDLHIWDAPGRRIPTAASPGGSIGESWRAWTAASCLGRRDTGRIRSTRSWRTGYRRSPVFGETVVAFLPDGKTLLTLAEACNPPALGRRIREGAAFRSRSRRSRMRSVSAPHRQRNLSVPVRLWTWRQVRPGTNSPSP